MSQTTHKPNPARRTLNEDEQPLFEVGWTARYGAIFFSLFVLVAAVLVLMQSTRSERYLMLKNLHFYLSRAGLIAASIMLVIAVYIGLMRHGDVTGWFRGITYTIVAFMLAQGTIGGIMYLMGGRPGEDVHMIYGYGVVLSLPFFIFVEVTARRRPAMGSYIWGFTLLAAIIVRCILTGPPGV